MGGSPAYVWRDGARLTPWMLYVILLLDADLFRAFGVHVLVSSGIRTYAEQEAIFRARYVTAGDVRGRRIYDTRVWNGVRWYRISPAGTVAVPSFSNHEIQGTRAAVDIRDTGSDAGITVASSARGRWIRDWARRTGLLIASGDSFGEGWHFDVPGIFRTPPPNRKPAPTTPPRRRIPMSTAVIYTDVPADSKRRGAIVNTENGFISRFGWFSVAYANSVAVGHGLVAAAAMTDGAYDAYLSDLNALAAKQGKVTVDLNDDDLPLIRG